jgi:dihydrolipoamide dehydrogenase
VVDFLHATTIAVVREVPLERLRHAVPSFPTRSEIWLSLFEQAGRQDHTRVDAEAVR